GSMSSRSNRTRGAVLAVALALAAPAVAAAQETHGPAESQEARSSSPASPSVYRAALNHRGTKIMISTNERRLLLVSGRDTLMDAPIGIGMGRDFEYEGRKFRFETPTGRRRVLSKSADPVWT